MKLPNFETTNVVDAATAYIQRGLQVVPLAEGTKACLEKDWLKLIFQPKDFQPTDNIGIRSVNGLIDIDCDSAEVVIMSKDFLPSTGAVYGRPSKPHAHWLYRSKFEKRVVYFDYTVSDEKQSTLVEIRVNHQSMAPPSIHPDDKELLAWEDSFFGDPAEISDINLTRAVQLLATAALVGRHYNPTGNRHDWCLALSGFMRQSLGITHDECKKIITSAANWAHDFKLQDRIAEVNSTYNHGDDDPLKSTGALKELMPKGPIFIKSLNRIWGPSGTAFRVDNRGEKVVSNDQENIKLALKRLDVELSYDTFLNKPKIRYKGYNGPFEQNIANNIWLQIDRVFHFRPTPDFFAIVMMDIAASNPFNPVQDYLAPLEWDGEPRVDTWIMRHAKAADTKYVRAVSAIMLIAAVRRILHPGCKYDELVVLESGQGQLKSSALRALCPREEWFSDDLPLNVDAKQIIERTQGKWIIEAAELSGMSKYQTEHLKSMLSRQVDGPVRMAYDRYPKEQARQFIIVGSTNAHVYLHDTTGNRRFWPIRTETFNVDAIIAERDQLWAEAVVREKKGESIRLKAELWDTATFQQERRFMDDPWQPILHSIFDKDVVRTSFDQIYDYLEIPRAHRTQDTHKRIVHIMLEKEGFIQKTVTCPILKNPVWGFAKGKWRKGRKLPPEATNLLDEENEENEGKEEQQ